MELNLQRKVVLITGGGSGIAKATALKFAQEGAAVIIFDKNRNSGLEVERMISQAGSFIEVDITDEAAIENSIYQIKNKFGKIDILFNCAGIEISGALQDFTLDSYDKVMNVNVKGTFLCSRSVLKIMLEQRSGVIINAASVAALVAWPDLSIYNASKAAVHMMTKSLAIEAAPYGIRVNCIAPAVIDTPMNFSVDKDENDKKIAKGKLHPLGRIGTPEEVADSVLFLSSERASFITGIILPIDGGYTAK